MSSKALIDLAFSIFPIIFVTVSFLRAHALATLHPIMFLFLVTEVSLPRLPLPHPFLCDKCIFILLALAPHLPSL